LKIHVSYYLALPFEERSSGGNNIGFSRMRCAMKQLLLIAFTFILAPITLQGPNHGIELYSTAMAVESRRSIVFTQNLGQWDSRISYRATDGDMAYYFGENSVSCMLTRQSQSSKNPESRYSKYPNAVNPDNIKALYYTIHFQGANLNRRIYGDGRLYYNYHYFCGNDPGRWRSNVPNYSGITYRDIYPGIDLKYYATSDGMKYDFIVEPGADFSVISLKYKGINAPEISSSGNLIVSTAFGAVIEKKPVIYQEIDGVKREITGIYEKRNDSSISFKLNSDYNHELPLIIDPELSYSTYLGGSSYDTNFGMAVDLNLCAIVTGATMSQDFPDFPPGDPIDSVWLDVYVTKFTPGGDSISYTAFVGGRESGETPGAVAVDENYDVYVTGYTTSFDFPLVNPYQSYAGNTDAFVFKLCSTGDTLRYCTCLGGSAGDLGYDIAIDDSGHAYITGIAESSDFPLHNPYQLDQPYDDAFVTKFSRAGNELEYSTYLGAENLEFGFSIAVDHSGCAYVTGVTYSSNFPLVNPFMTDFPLEDAFVTKFNPAGDNLEYSTYYGGSGMDRAMGIAIDENGSAYISGVATSDDLPLQNPCQYDQPDQDGYVAKFSPDGYALEYATYLGGNRVDRAENIAVDSEGNAYLTGSTESTNFPGVEPLFQDPENYDSYLTKLSPSGNEILFSSYLGGSSADYGYGIAVDKEGDAYLSGFTYSPDFPLHNQFLNNQASSDCFLSKITGMADQTSVRNDGNRLPGALCLRCYPNPFNSQTIIGYQLQTDCQATISIYNILGARVAILADEMQSAGEHSIIWQADNISSGLYFVRISAGGRSEFRKLSLVR
jgi:hypothetical protein